MIKSLEKSSVHRITSGQVLVDLQTAVKELVENSLDAGATSIEVKFKEYGLKSFEISDNGSGISSEDYESVALKHCTSKLSSFEDLASVQTFGFRGEALSSLCALSKRVTITTATVKEAPVGTVLEFDRIGKLKSSSGKAARMRGTTVAVEGLFDPLPVRRKEFERNSKREFGKALNLLYAYALVPCTKENKGVRLSVVHIPEKGRKTDQLRTDGKPSLRSSISSLWGPKQLDSLVELCLDLSVAAEKTVLRRQGKTDSEPHTIVKVRGYISKFTIGSGRTSTDRQYFYINGRPCNPTKIQKTFNEVYRSFVVNQSPLIIADFILPTDSCDVNVSPDKRTILLHSEDALVNALKEELEKAFSPSRSTFAVQSTQARPIQSQRRIDRTHLNESKETNIDNSEPQDADFNEESSSNNTVEAKDTPQVLDTTSSSEVAILEPLTAETKPKENSMSSQTSSLLVDAPHAIESGNFPKVSEISKESTILYVPSGIKRAHEPCRNTDSHSVQLKLATKDSSWEMRLGNDNQPEKRRRIEAKPRTALRSRLIAYRPGGGMADTVVVYNNDERSEIESDDQGSDVDELDNEGDPDVIMAGTEVDKEVTDTRKCEHSGYPDDMEVDSNLVDVDKHRATGNTISDEICQVPPLFLPESEMEVQSDNIEDGSVNSSPVIPERIIQNRPLSDIEPSTLIGNASENDTAVEKSTGIEVFRTTDDTSDLTLSFDNVRVGSVWSSLANLSMSTMPSGSKSSSSKIVVGASAGLSNTTDEESAERELSRVISKEDFSRMDILGQFNLGFIIARRRVRGDESAVFSSQSDNINHIRDQLDDLFIIDQHAADEKYNFETLQRTTKIDSQKLFRPLPLDLTAADELIAIENVDILRDNGFEISIDDDTADDNEEQNPVRRRVKLVSQPVSGNTDFTIKDLEELLHLLRDNPSMAQKRMIRCSKARSMFAMRACRKSVMIGMALNKTQMTSVVRHMGTMDLPWNCPHGRPTMRHLVSLSDIGNEASSIGPVFRSISWKNLD